MDRKSGYDFIACRMVPIPRTGTAGKLRPEKIQEVFTAGIYPEILNGAFHDYLEKAEYKFLVSLQAA